MKINIYDANGIKVQQADLDPTQFTLDTSVTPPVLRLITTPTPPPGNQWSVGYWNSVGAPVYPIPVIDWTAMSHLVHWAALVNADASLNLAYNNMTQDAQALVSAAHAHGVKVIFGIANPSWIQGQSGNMAAVCASPTLRAALVKNTMAVVNQYGYDGVDVDWEPGPPNIAQFGLDLRAALGASRAMTADAIVTDYNYWGPVSAPFDRINVMTYDLTGTWNPYSWFNSALNGPVDNAVWSVDLAVKRFTAGGLAKSKLSIGLAFFGYNWQIPINQPRQTWTVTPPAPTQSPYNVLTAGGRPILWDTASQTPYYASPFATFDNADSLTAKINYTKAQSLGGWIMFNIGMGYVSQTPANPLLAAVSAARK